MKFLVVFAFLFCFISEGLSQKSLNDYSFVIVPEKFDFVNEKDKYQLNSLTKFLFNKHGFNAFFDSDRPNVKRCDGLYAEVDGVPAMIRTRVTVILKDCYGDEVYRSEIGKSKLKAYNKTYTAALRNAFLSIAALGVEQKEPVTFDESEVNVEEGQTSKEKVEVSPIEVEEVISVEREDANNNLAVEKALVETVVAESLYTSNGNSFTLRKTKSGYKLYEKLQDGDNLKGTLLIKEGKSLQFTDIAGNKFPGHFDADENLIIETSFQKLVFTKQR
ncbi:MAG: hypothetical protein AAF489_05495 [Bacteroidota bacterium]